MHTAGRFLLVVAMMIILAGCQRALNDQRKVEVKNGEVKSVLYDVQQREKTVKVAIRSEAEAVDAYLVLEKDRAQLVERLGLQDKPSDTLASAIRTKDATLQGRIPAKSAFAVILVSPKDTSVTVRVTEDP